VNHSDQQLAHLSALTALNQMLENGTFYISTVDEVAKAIGALPDGQAYKILRPLHCVKIRDMPAELRAALPQLIERCINVPAYQFQVTAVTPEQQLRITASTVRRLTR
jgi:hypothetical protein